MNGQGDTLGVEDRALESKYKNLPFLFVFPLFTAFLCILFSLAAVLVSPAYIPKNYIEGTSLFNHLIPIIVAAAFLGGALMGYWRSTVTRVIDYGNLTAMQFRKGFLPKLTAAEGWSLKGQSEKYFLYQHGKAQVLICFRPEGMLVKCPLRMASKVKALASRVP